MGILMNDKKIPKKKHMTKSVWYRSYETCKFNTPDGDIDVGQYAVSESGRFIIRREQKNNGNTLNEKQKNAVLDLQEVTFSPIERKYFHEFLMADGRIYRIETAKDEYYNIAKNNIIPQKELTDVEMSKIKQDDLLWPHYLTKIPIQGI